MAPTTKTVVRILAALVAGLTAGAGGVAAVRPPPVPCPVCVQLPAVVEAPVAPAPAPAETAPTLAPVE